MLQMGPNILVKNRIQLARLPHSDDPRSSTSKNKNHNFATENMTKVV